MADIPDGLTRQETLEILDAFKQAGADIVKLELHSDADLWIVEATQSRCLSPAVHLGINALSYSASIEDRSTSYVSRAILYTTVAAIPCLVTLLWLFGYLPASSLATR